MASFFSFLSILCLGLMAIVCFLLACFALVAALAMLCLRRANTRSQHIDTGLEDDPWFMD